MKQLTFLIFLLSIFQYVHAQPSKFEKWSNMTEASVKDTVFRVSSMSNDAVDIPVTFIRGSLKGPTFTIIAGIHGMEYPTILSLLELRREIDPKKLKGNLIIIPIVNQTSFYQRRPFVNPMDSLNLNRVFPGDPKGSITEVMADFISREVFAVTDILLDMHGGDAGEDLIPFMCYYNNKEFEIQTKQSLLLCEASGFNTIVSYPYILQTDKSALYAFKQAVRQGITAFSMEIGKLGNWDRSELVMAKDAIYRMMSALKMYQRKKINPRNTSITYYDGQTYVSVPVQGIFYSSFQAGDIVHKGTEIGYIADIFGNILNRLTAPKTGIILYKVGTPPVNKGETLFCIGHQYDKED